MGTSCNNAEPHDKPADQHACGGEQNDARQWAAPQREHDVQRERHRQAEYDEAAPEQLRVPARHQLDVYKRQSLYVAPVGHTRRHAGFSQCWQAIGRCEREILGYVPCTPTSNSQFSLSTRFHVMPIGTLFCILHAMAHVLHPVQRLKSMAMANRVI